MGNIYVALSTFAEFGTAPIDLLNSSGIPYQMHTSGKRITKGELFTNGSDAEVIIAGVEPYDEEVFAALPKLKCISRCGVGVDAIDLASAKKRNITILNTPDIPTVAVAELAMSFYFSLCRNLRAQANSMGNKHWVRLEAHLLNGKTIGIIGFGRIGRKIAEYCKPFGVNLLVCDPFVDVATIAQYGAKQVDKETLLKGSDIVSIHASKSAGNSLLIAKNDYGLMKKGSMLVNLSRGGMIDEESLIEALQSKHLAGAGLDVFAEEPYHGPLCEMENVILTPHSATQTIETRVAMEVECVDKALRFLSNRIEPNEKVI